MVHKPREPAPGECCGSGCARCVWDIYYDNLDKYEAHRMERKQQLKIKRQAGVERKVLDIEDLRNGAEVDDDDDDFDDDESESDAEGTADVGHVSASAVGSVVVKYEMSAMGGTGGPSKVDKVLDTLLLGDASQSSSSSVPSPEYVGQLREYLYGEDASDVASLDADEMKRFGGMDAEGDDDEEERSNKSSMMVGGASSNNHGVYGVSSDSAVRRFPESFGAELASKYAGGPDRSKIDSHIINLLQHRVEVLGVGADAGVEAAISALTSEAPGFAAKRLRQEILMKAKQRLRRLVVDTEELKKCGQPASMGGGESDTPSSSINVCLLPPKAVDYVIGSSAGKESQNTAVPIEAANPHLGALVRLYDAASPFHMANTDDAKNASSTLDVRSLLENAHQHYVDGGWRFVESVHLTASSSTPYIRGAANTTGYPTNNVADDAPLCLIRLGLTNVAGGACRNHPPDSTPVPGDVLDLYTENSDNDVLWLCKRLGLQPARKLSLSPSPFGPEGGFPRWLPSPFNHRYHYGVTLQESGRLQLQNVDANLKRLEADFSDVAPSTSDEHVVRDAEERQRRAKEKQSSIIEDALLSDDSDEGGDKGVPTTTTATSAVSPPSPLWLSGRCLAHMTAKHLFQRYVDLHSSAYLRPPLFTMLSGCIRDPVGYDEKPILSILSAGSAAAKNGEEGLDVLRTTILESVDIKVFKDEDLVKSFEFYLQRAALQLLTHTHRSQQTTGSATPRSLGYLTTPSEEDGHLSSPPQSFATQRDTHQTLTRLVNTTSPSMRDILATFSHCKPNLPRLLEVAAPLRPRRFSVASVQGELQQAATGVPLASGQSVDLVVRQIVKNAPRPSSSARDEESGGDAATPGMDDNAFQTALYSEMGVFSLLQCVKLLHHEALQLPPSPSTTATPMRPEPFCGFITQRLLEMAMSHQHQPNGVLAGKRSRESPIWARHVPVRAQPRFSPTTPSTITSDVTETKVRQLLDRSKCPVMPLFPIPLPTSRHIASPLSTTCTVAPHHPVYVIAGGSGYAPLRGWLFQRLATQRQLLRTSPTAAIGTTTVLMGLRRCAEAVVFAQEMEPWSRLDEISSSLPLSVNAYLSRVAEDGSNTSRYPHAPSFLNLHAGMRMTLGEGADAIFMDPSVGNELAAAIIDDPTPQPPSAATTTTMSVVRSLPSSDTTSTSTTTSGGVIVACGPGPFLTSIREAIISSVGSSSRLLPAEDRGDRSIAEHHMVRAEYDRRVVFDTWKAA